MHESAPGHPRRRRPFIGGSVGADVAARVQAEAERSGKPLARVLDALLRKALGLPDDDAADTIRPGSRAGEAAA